jgi:hypothetical protein
MSETFSLRRSITGVHGKNKKDRVEEGTIHTVLAEEETSFVTAGGYWPLLVVDKTAGLRVGVLAAWRRRKRVLNSSRALKPRLPVVYKTAGLRVGVQAAWRRRKRVS